MVTTPLSLSSADRLHVLRFAASFVWADFEVAASERRFLEDLARELDVDASEVARLLERAPTPEDVDPSSVSGPAADLVRHAALRAIAADGRVDDAEMQLFELLDDLLPKGPFA